MLCSVKEEAVKGGKGLAGGGGGCTLALAYNFFDATDLLDRYVLMKPTFPFNIIQWN